MTAFTRMESNHILQQVLMSWMGVSNSAHISVFVDSEIVFIYLAVIMHGQSILKIRFVGGSRHFNF